MSGPVDEIAGATIVVTGHSGFTGGWLVMVLRELGANVIGMALPPDRPSLVDALGLEADLMACHHADVRDSGAVFDVIGASGVDAVMHLAAQPIVRRSYTDPPTTWSTNVMGTVNVIEAALASPSVRACLVVTSDKCYRQPGVGRAFVEGDPLGGHDPYSASKAAEELVAESYRASFGRERGTSIVTARAGNIVGAGDWAPDRIMPDCVRAFAAGDPMKVRSPGATRPWQHVLDAVHGYVAIIRASLAGAELAGSYNLGPSPVDLPDVRWVVEKAAASWGGGATWEIDREEHPHEAPTLSLDSDLAAADLGWWPLLDHDETVEWTIAGYRALLEGRGRGLIEEQVADHLAAWPGRAGSR